jgi:hypothetical protein
MGVTQRCDALGVGNRLYSKHRQGRNDVQESLKQEDMNKFSYKYEILKL